MDYKKQYRLYCRIAIGISAILAAIATCCLIKSLNTNFLMIFFGVFLSCMHLLFLIIGYKKRKNFDKMLGFIKTDGKNHWLGYDGNWHDGYKDIYPKKLDRYYKNGGKDFGYSPSFYMTLLFLLLGCGGGIGMMMGWSGASGNEQITYSVIVLITSIYAILRQAVLG